MIEMDWSSCVLELWGLLDLSDDERSESEWSRLILTPWHSCAHGSGPDGPLHPVDVSFLCSKHNPVHKWSLLLVYTVLKLKWFITASGNLANKILFFIIYNYIYFIIYNYIYFVILLFIIISVSFQINRKQYFPLNV